MKPVSQITFSKLPTVAYLGPEGTFTEQAARKYFTNFDVNYDEKPSIRDVFLAVERRDATYGVVPVENSIEGSVNITLDLLYKLKVRIKGEIIEKIHHNLIVNPYTKKSEIKIILSHPQALAQSRVYIEKNFSKAKLVETPSTAIAVSKLTKMKTAAAVGTELAAKTYKMKIISRNISNIRQNYTRFFVLCLNDSALTGDDRTSLTFTLKHEPGALFNFLKPFASRGINLSKIESRPFKEKLWRYIFFMDFEGHRENKKCKAAINEAVKLCDTLKVLGSYRKGISYITDSKAP